MRGGCDERRHAHQNVLEYVINVRECVIVPVAKHDVAMRLQPPRPSVIVPDSVRVLPTVKLDDEHSLRADEIDNESAYRMLSAELEPAEPAVAQAPAEQRLRVCLPLAQLE